MIFMKFALKRTSNKMDNDKKGRAIKSCTPIQSSANRRLQVPSEYIF